MSLDELRQRLEPGRLVQVAALPTPFHRLERLSVDLGREVWIKRDDLTGLAMGGNKARKLRWLMANALADGASCVVTAGAAQSNHARMTAAAAASVGLGCHLVLGGEADASGNALLDHLLGARIHWMPGADWRELNDRVFELAESLDGGVAIPMGGASPLGCLGYADAAVELAGDLAANGFANAEVFFASGTGGTHAGLEVGLDLLENAGDERRLTLRPIAVAQPDELPDAVASLVRKTSALIATSHERPQAPTETRFMGDQYGEATPGCLAAIAMFAEREGILLDPVYSGKAADALITLCRTGEIDQSATVVFLHTGGAPALFSKAYAPLFEPGEIEFSDGDPDGIAAGS